MCDESFLRTLMVLPKTTTLTYANISHVLCQLDPVLATNISLKLVKNLQVSSMIANVSISIFLLTVYCRRNSIGVSNNHYSANSDVINTTYSVDSLI